MKQPLLSIRNLSIDLPERGDRLKAVEDVSISLSRNELLCIVGESGSGKSVLAHAIMGLLPKELKKSSGEIRLGGEEISRISEKDFRHLRGSEIAMIFQEPMTALNPLMRIGDQIDETIRYHRNLPASERLTILYDAIDAVGLTDPERIAKSYPYQISGGQRQRVMIAIALSLEPKLLIADEPTTALDVTTQAQILELLRQIQRDRQMGVIFITHDFGVVAEIADQVAVLKQGKLVESGNAEQVLSDPQHPYTVQLLNAVPKFPKEARVKLHSEDNVLVVQGLKKIYNIGGLWRKGRKIVAVNDVSFTLAKGETLSVVGESGSGKSSLGRVLMHLSDADAGSVHIGDCAMSELKGLALRRARRRIQMVFQDPYSSLNPRWQVGKQIARGMHAQGRTWKESMESASHWLERVGLDGRSLNRYPHEFSGGQRQRIAIARALSLMPDVIIADEPVSALDVTVQEQVLRLFESIQEEFQLSIVFITHDLRIAARISDRIAVMNKGQIVELDVTHKLLNSPKEEYTRSLISAVPGRDWVD